MQLNEITFDDAQPIDGYGPGFFRVAGQILQGPILVLATGAKSWGGYDDLSTLLDITSTIDVLFVGTGAEIAHVPENLREQLEATGVGVEQMNSPSACRTYNILVSEGRRVGAALLPL
ncbi:MAG: Mth938-like domain-containing protein [Pseudoruegeria sp.]